MYSMSAVYGSTRTPDFPGKRVPFVDVWSVVSESCVDYFTYPVAVAPHSSPRQFNTMQPELVPDPVFSAAAPESFHSPRSGNPQWANLTAAKSQRRKIQCRQPQPLSFQAFASTIGAPGSSTAQVLGSLAWYRRAGRADYGASFAPKLAQARASASEKRAEMAM